MSLDRRVGLTQLALSRKLRVDVSTVGHWERGTSVPPLPYWPRLLKVLGADPAPTASTLAEQILALRRRLGLSQAELAVRLDIRPGSISFWEFGGQPLFATAKHLERALQVEGI